MKPTEEILDRLWYLIKNMGGHDLCCEWIEEVKDGTYLDREEVLELIENEKKLISSIKTDNKSLNLTCG